MNIVNNKEYIFKCWQCGCEFVFSKADCTYCPAYNKPYFINCPNCRESINEEKGIFNKEYKAEDSKDKEIERLKQEHEAIKKYIHNHTITYIDNGIECCKPDEYFNISWVEDMLNGNFENLDVLFEDSEDNE